MFVSLGITKLKFSDTEIEFGRQDTAAIELIFDDAIESIGTFRKRLSIKLDKYIKKNGIDIEFWELTNRILDDLDFGEQFRSDIRCTIHIQDYIFFDRLFQLFDYFPSGDGFGRDFSTRMGIIGRVWRSGVASANGRLLDELQNGDYSPSKAHREKICLEWGLTALEAERFMSRPSYCCVPIEKSGRRVGLFFMDCRKVNFGLCEEGQVELIKETIEKHISESSIFDFIVKMEDDFEALCPRVTFDGKK